MIGQYKIKFYRKNLHGRILFGMNSINSLLDQFVTQDQKLSNIDETLDAVNALLNGEINEINYTRDSGDTVIANNQTTTLYDDPNLSINSPKFSLPTSDFKLIIEAWKNFVLAG